MTDEMRVSYYWNGKINIPIYVSSVGNFYATTADGVDHSTFTLDGVKKLLKKHYDNKRKFAPINIVYVSDDVEGRITSRDAKYKHEFRVTLPTGYGDDGKASYKHTLSRYGRYKKFVVATPENLGILRQIKGLQVQVDALRAEQDGLRQSYTMPVTEEYIEGRETK